MRDLLSQKTKKAFGEEIGKEKIHELAFSEIEDNLTEVEKEYTGDEASIESQRCYLCYLKYEIDTERCIYCFACIDNAPRDCIKMIEGVEIKKDGTYGEYIETRDWSRVGSPSALAINSSAPDFPSM